MIPDPVMTMPEIALPPTVAGRLRGFYGRRDMPGL